MDTHPITLCWVTKDGGLTVYKEIPIETKEPLTEEDIEAISLYIGKFIKEIYWKEDY